jgi:CBS domain-containing protein
MVDMMNRLDSKRIQVREILEVQTTAWPLLDITAGDCMTRNPIHVTSNTTLSDIIQLYHAKQFRHLLVVDEFKGLVGVISDRDVLHGQREKLDQLHNSRRTTAGDIMSRDLIVVEEKSRVIDSLRLMVKNGINCLPVQDDGRLVGILTSTDLYMVLEFLLDPYGATKG